MTETKKEEKKVRIFHTGGIYGPLDTGNGRLEPGRYLDVKPELSKKLVGAYKHVKLASDVIPGAKSGGSSKESDKKVEALTKEVDDLNKRGEEMGERFGEVVEKNDAALKDIGEKCKALDALYAQSEKNKKGLEGVLAEFLKVSDKKLKDLQKKHANVLKPKEDKPSS